MMIKMLIVISLYANLAKLLVKLVVETGVQVIMSFGGYGPKFDFTINETQLWILFN